MAPTDTTLYGDGHSEENNTLLTQNAGARSEDYLVISQGGSLRAVRVIDQKSTELWPSAVRSLSVCSAGLVAFASGPQDRYKSDLVVLRVDSPGSSVLFLRETGYDPQISPDCSTLAYIEPTARFDKAEIARRMRDNFRLRGIKTVDELIAQYGGQPPSETTIKVRPLRGSSGATVTGQPPVKSGEQPIFTTRGSGQGQPRMGEFAELDRWSSDSTQLLFRTCVFLVYETLPCLDTYTWRAPIGPVRGNSLFDRELADGSTLTGAEGTLSIKKRNETQDRYLVGSFPTPPPARPGDVAEEFLFRFEISPSGQRVAFSTSQRDGSRNVQRWRLRVYDVRSGSGQELYSVDVPMIRIPGGPYTVPPNDHGIYGVQWSPDESAVVYERQIGAELRELWLVQLARPRPIRLARGTTPVAFIRGTNAMVFKRIDASPSEIWMTQFDGTGETMLAVGAADFKVTRVPTDERR